MINKNDWRIMGQEEYLFGVQLLHIKYKPANDRNTHDHCEFCGKTFFLLEGYLHCGYCTEDRYLWICDVCFSDFQDRFKWIVIQTKGDDRLLRNPEEYANKENSKET